MNIAEESFDPSLGTFIVPNEGTYSFQFDGDVHQGSTQACIRVLVNGDIYKEFHEYDPSADWRTINGMVAINLKSGDKVKLYNYFADSIYSSGVNGFTFVGSVIY